MRPSRKTNRANHRQVDAGQNSSCRMAVLINTPLQRGVGRTRDRGNRFNGFPACQLGRLLVRPPHVTPCLLSCLVAPRVGYLGAQTPHLQSRRTKALGALASVCLGYGTFSVSHSGVGDVARYIARQNEHHRKRGFAEELRRLVERYGLKWREDETVETVSSPPQAPTPR